MERAGERSLCPPQGPAPEQTGDGGPATRTVRSLAGRVQRHAAAFLRMCVGTVFLWFGVLKFFPEASPAEGVAVRTATKLTLGLLPPDVVLRTLAAFETAIGLGLVTGVLLRIALVGFFAHMAGVFSALVLLPGEMWQEGAPVPTLEGQYIIKNVVLIAACLVVAADEWDRDGGAMRTSGGPERTDRRVMDPPEHPTRYSLFGTECHKNAAPQVPGSHPSSRSTDRSPHRDEVP
ncbi:DoxX family protein [Streptomyces fulvorobeus]|uniref:Putative membrane protein YkgB n=1 Tax=Streptomyces fulvorobeus TaxID=284028 RepID=A0A7J0BZN7_9ACTN|nr:putative membrane protein YkgB [Streptomyces fulvorobeus]GFM95638.1 hypothetical protein Sfulv_04490 [Streptomyces fulvorobeus]